MELLETLKAIKFSPNRFLTHPLRKDMMVFDPNKISGVGTIFGLLVHVLPGTNKQRGLEPSMILS
jgi:hypothetical protein